MDPQYGTSNRFLPVLGSILAVWNCFRHVRLHPEMLDDAVERWGKSSGEGGGYWEHPCHYADGTEETARWVFVLDLLNHCFWPDRGGAPWTVEFEGRSYDGYFALAAALKRTMLDGVPLTDAGFLARMELAELRHILAGRGEIPLLEERLANVREAGSILLDSWGGDVLNLIRAARGSAVSVVRLTVDSFPSFRDEARYDGRPVFFWKRAQIFASDLSLASGGADWGALPDLDRLTAFADYKLPQVLRDLGILEYSPDLARRVDAFEHLPPGSAEEVEIRATTILAVEGFREAFRKAGEERSGASIDNWLWQLGQMDRFRRRPYHRCRTIFY